MRYQWYHGIHADSCLFKGIHNLEAQSTAGKGKGNVKMVVGINHHITSTIMQVENIYMQPQHLEVHKSSFTKKYASKDLKSFPLEAGHLILLKGKCLVIKPSSSKGPTTMG